VDDIPDSVIDFLEADVLVAERIAQRLRAVESERACVADPGGFPGATDTLVE
jgi:hypothetical protein